MTEGENSNNVNSNVYNTDYEKAAAIYAKVYADQNHFDWRNQLLMPSITATAQLIILNWQQQQYERINKQRMGLIDSAAKNFTGCTQSILERLKDAVDGVPYPAMYQPVSPGGELWEMLSENIEMMPTMAHHSCLMSEYSRQQDLIRVECMAPKFKKIKEWIWGSIEKLIQGDLPIGLTIQAYTKTAEDAVARGRIGRAHGQYRRNLGLTSYGVELSAREEYRREIAFYNEAVNPISRQADIRTLPISPTARIEVALNQAALIQQNLQSAYNACARKPPYLLAQANMMFQRCLLKLQLESGKASLLSNYVPDYLGLFQGQINDIAQGVANSTRPRQTTAVEHPPAPQIVNNDAKVNKLTSGTYDHVIDPTK